MVALEFLLFIDSRNEKKRELGGEKDNKKKNPSRRSMQEEEKPLARRGLARPCRQLLRRRACTRTRVCACIW